MIICSKCQADNPSEDKICQSCGAKLLPGESIKERLGTLIIGIVACLVAGLIAYFLIRNPEITESSEICLFSDPSAWMFASAFGLITAIVSAVRKTPEFRKYESRAKRHQELEPDQSLMDFSRAIELAPDKHKAALIKSRADLYQALGREEESLKDQLTYMEAEGAYESSSSFVTALGGDKDTYVDQTIKAERKKMISEGKIKGVAYCTKCQQAVELNEKLKCPLHPKAGLVNATYVLPQELDKTLESVGTAAAEEVKKLKKRRRIILIVIGVILMLCVVIPLLTSILLE